MRKKNKLYTVNRFNREMFKPNENLFANPFGSSQMQIGGYNPLANLNSQQMAQLKAFNLSANMTPKLTTSSLGLGTLGNTGGMGSLSATNPTEFFGLGSNDGAPKVGGLKGLFSKDNINGALGAAGTSLATAGAGILGGLASNALSGGMTSEAGEVVGSIGSAALGAAGTAIGGPIGGAIGSAVGNVLGGLTNRMFGSKLNQENINAVENNISKITESGNAVGNAQSNEELLANAGNMQMGFDFSNGFIGSDGWFSTKARDKARELRRKQETARAFAKHALTTGAENADANMDFDIMSNFAAYGGPLTRRYGLGGNLFYNGGMSQSDLWKAANDLVVTPKANMTRAQYNYHSAYDGDAAKGFVKAIPGIGDAANAVEAVDNYVNGKANTANTSLTEQAALTGLSNLKVRGLPVGKVASTAYNAGKNILSSLGMFADGGYLFGNGGGTYNEVSNEISPDLTPVVSREYQPLADQLKQQEAGYNIDDYSYRVQKLHPDITREQVAEAYNNVPVIASSIDNKQFSSTYSSGNKNNKNYGHRIMLYGLGRKGANSNNVSDVAGKALAYETDLLFMDKVLGDKSTEDEKDMLWEAYSPFVFNSQEGDEEMHNERATNAGLRKSISQKYGNVTGADLDKAIDNISDQELSDMYFNQNGYVNKEGKKHFRPSAVRKALKTVAYNTDKNPYGVSDTFNITAMGGPLFMNNSRNLFDLGGDLQTHGADWSDGLITIGAGGTHEENKYDGVQLGKDMNSVPNLVEEGETVWNDYVFSNRILADDATKQMFKLPKKKDITFADISKKLEKEIAERPNDPISKAGFEAQMQTLEEQQERQKSEMEAERARAAFEALSPEEQTAVMQNVAEQEAMAEQTAQEQAMAEQQAMQQPSEEEIAMMQQQGQPEVMGEEEYAYGGNLFVEGGPEDILAAKMSNVDTRSDTTRQGNHEGTIPYGAGRQLNTLGPLGTLMAGLDEFDRQTNMTRPDSPIYKPGLITGEAPVPTSVGGKAKTAAEAMQMVKAMKAAKAAKIASTSKVPRIGGSSFIGKSPEEVARISAQRSAAGKKAAEVRRVQGPTEKQQHQFDAARAAAEKRAQQQGMVRANREASKMSGKDFTPSWRNAQGKRSTNYGAITVDDIYAEGGHLYKDGGSWDWDTLFTMVNDFSKQRGNNADRYKIDTSYDGDVKALEGSDVYKNFTDYILNKATDDERLNYFKWIDNNTGRINKYIKDGKLRADWKENYEAARNDGKYGIQHYNPTWVAAKEAAPVAEEKPAYEPQTYHAMDGDDYDGYIEGELDPNYVGAETRRETLPNGDTVIYHGKPAKAEATPEEPEKEIEPVRKADWLRYAGLFGPAVGLGMQLAGVGKPDYSRLDAAVANAGKVHLAGYKPIGDYLTYRPMDIWYEQNRMDANARATDRAIQNNAGPLGTKMAGLLASGYNNQIADGELYRKALEYNDAKRERVAEFNRGTNKYNADAYNRNQEFNTSALNHGNQFQQGLAMQAAQERLNRDAGWYNGIYGNVGQLFKGIGDLGRENRETNWRNALVTSGAFGAMDEDALVKAGIAKYKKGKKASKGGKINKKRGLTY